MSYLGRYTVDLGKRDVCTTGVVLHQIFGSIYAVGKGNRHLCTTGNCATAGIWVGISSRHLRHTLLCTAGVVQRELSGPVLAIDMG